MKNTAESNVQDINIQKDKVKKALDNYIAQREEKERQA